MVEILTEYIMVARPAVSIETKDPSSALREYFFISSSVIVLFFLS